MQQTRQRLSKRQQVIVAAVTGSLIIAILAITLGARAASLEAHAVGVWNCTGVHTDTARARHGEVYDPDGQVPPPFDALDDFDPGLETHTYRAPRSGYRTPVVTARIIVQPHGRFEFSGIPIERETLHTGTWSTENDLLVIRFDRLDRNHAVQLEQGNPQATALTWERPPRPPALYDLRLGWNDTGIDLAFSSAVGGYAATCLKLTDDAP